MFDKAKRQMEAMREASHVPPALEADEAAYQAHERDKSLTKHHFEPHEHPCVRIEHLMKTFDGETQVLSDVNLTVWPGEVVCVLGPSGSASTPFIACTTIK